MEIRLDDLSGPEIAALLREHLQSAALHSPPESVHALDRQGIAARLMTHLLDEAERRGYERLSLETGSMDAFAPARNLYARFGFEPCPPFGDYSDDPYSVFMSKRLRPQKEPAHACDESQIRSLVSAK